ncbi:MAG: alginate export family protein [Bacteroidota bacterium]
MMNVFRGILLLCLLKGIAVLAFAQTTESFDFNFLRQQDNLYFLKGKENKNLYEKWKFLSLGEKSAVSWGGSLRSQYEHFINEDFDNVQDKYQGWYLQRMLFHTDWRIDKWQFFAELNNSLISGKPILTPVDKDELSFNQLFLAYHGENMTFKLGRENLNIGSRRLIDLREGPNVRRSFDHVGMTFHRNNYQLHLLYGIPVNIKEGIFDNEALHDDEALWGAYMSHKFASNYNFDIYYLGFKADNKQYETGVGRERRHSLGVRFWGEKDNWQMDNEFVFQLGGFMDQSINAWTISFKIENHYTPHQHFGLKTELISGDKNPNDSKLGTFNPLYPRGAYFGRVARFGPSNLIDIHPYWVKSFGDLSIMLDYVAFWRFSKDDAIYGPAVTYDFPDESETRWMAHQIGALLTYEPSSFLTLELETNHIVPGSFLRETMGDDNLFHLVITVDIRF